MAWRRVLVGELPKGMRDAFAETDAMYARVVGLRFREERLFTDADDKVWPLITISVIVRDPGGVNIAVTRKLNRSAFFSKSSLPIELANELVDMIRSATNADHRRRPA